eukprot:CAMPEP_0115306462 /NCGR_PEP_ID=MMETSP0270-20121206/72597_1 /TAXON_ID=71861 /ORGANISM="Scrippsiella trochoidea, Strain CCMP3099" /LENGTH=166 /DNA_ID=CAMNT_0002724793 /DNA_START=127 /DNA_END=625 /DNA_ORIENTATION=+
MSFLAAEPLAACAGPPPGLALLARSFSFDLDFMAAELRMGGRSAMSPNFALSVWGKRPSASAFFCPALSEAAFFFFALWLRFFSRWRSVETFRLASRSCSKSDLSTRAAKALAAPPASASADSGEGPRRSEPARCPQLGPRRPTAPAPTPAANDEEEEEDLRPLAP